MAQGTTHAPGTPLPVGTKVPNTVAIVNSSGDQVSSFGGGTEYTVNAVAPADPVGTTLVAERDDQLAALAEVEGDWTNVRATAKGALWVAIPDANGDPLTSFGGGTEYTEGAIDTTITGGAALAEGPSDTLTPLQVDASKRLLVAIAADTAGLATSAIQTTQSGYLDGLEGLLTTIDGDTGILAAWDETARAKVNLIAGQVGVQGGAGASTALTQRVALATDANAITVASLPLPTGAATSALQTQPGVDIGDVTVNNAAGAAAVNIQDGGNIITVDGTVSVSGAVDTELPAAAAISAENTAAPTAPSIYNFPLLFDGTNWDRAPGTSVDGALVNLGANNDVTVTSLPALVAGSANIGDVDILTIAAGDNNIGNVDIVTLPALVAGSANIGDVDVLTVPADPFGVNADAASATGSISAKLRFIAATGIPVTSLPNVTLAAGTNTNEVVGDVAGDIPLVANPLTVGGRASAAAPADVSLDGDAVNAWHLRNGAQAVVLTAAGALIGGDAANGADVDVTRLPALVAGTANIGDVDVLTVPADPFGANADAASATGSISAKLRFIAATGIPVTALPASTNTLEVVGDVASDVAIAANPVTVGARASTAVPTAVAADGRAVNVWANRSGAPVVTMAPHVGLNSDPWNLVHEAAQFTTTQTSAIFIAGGASEKIVVTKVQIQVFGTNAGDCILYMAVSGAYSRGTSRAIFDGTFIPSATSAPGVVLDGPFITGTNGDDILITTTGNLNVTVSVWYYVVT